MKASFSLTLTSPVASPKAPPNPSPTLKGKLTGAVSKGASTDPAEFSILAPKDERSMFLSRNGMLKPGGS